MMTELAKDDIILQAALHFGVDHLYYIKDSNMGLTLYAEVKDKAIMTKGANKNEKME